MLLSLRCLSSSLAGSCVRRQRIRLYAFNGCSCLTRIGLFCRCRLLRLFDSAPGKHDGLLR